MALGPRLDLRTAQSLVLSPQMQAAIRLLALSNVELSAELASELERNPLLETADEDGLNASVPGEGASGAGPAGAEGGDEAAGEALDMPVGDGDPRPAAEALADDATVSADSLDVDLVEERFHHDSPADSGRAGEGEDGSAIEQLAGAGESLASALTRQAEARLEGRELAIALAIIAVIDEAGYVTEPLAEIAERLGAGEAELERVLMIVQSFEPTGVGARNLAECIRLQARERDRLDPCMAALIDNLDLVARGDLERLRRLCDVDAEDLADMLRELRSYDPKPGLAFGGGAATAVVPDLFVRRTARGYAIELNAATLPRLIVNRQYQAHIARHAAQRSNPGEARFLDTCLAQAQWLIRALDQRANTILKVASEIVAQQAGFFEHGVAHLRPLTLKAVADAIEVHESTVSRVTSNKYLACDRGTFELKYFFSSGVHSNDGSDDVAMAAVKAKLKALIDSEPPLKPLSDDKLVELLRQEGHDLARRTVTKYRESMHIPSSYDRRRRNLVKAA
ncbi:RNA polymerase factor sigma-54 [Thermaurantiacus sp.]